MTTRDYSNFLSQRWALSNVHPTTRVSFFKKVQLQILWFWSRFSQKPTFVTRCRLADIKSRRVRKIDAKNVLHADIIILNAPHGAMTILEWFIILKPIKGTL